MATINIVQRMIRDRINSYQDECDLWKADHKAAKQVFDFCDLLRDGLELHKEICRLDEHWRQDVYARRIAYDGQMAQRIESLFQHFGRVALDIEQELLPHFENSYEIADGTAFRNCCQELRGLLTADKEFFADDRLVALRDQALDDHAEGKTIEHWSS